MKTETNRCAAIDALERRYFLAAGDIDTTFGDGGLVTFDVPRAVASSSLLELPGGRIVVAGAATPWTGSSAHATILEMHRADGSVDRTFGVGGRARIDALPIGETVIAMAVAPDGKLLVLGEGNSYDGPRQRFVARFTATGAVDTTFGQGGVVLIPSPPQNQASLGAMQFGVDASGRPVVAEVIWRLTMNSSYLSIRRLTANGSPDSSFGNAGVAQQEITRGPTLSDIRVDNNGIATVLGGGQEIYQFNSAGALAGQINARDAAGTSVYGVDSVFLPDGKFVMLETRPTMLNGYHAQVLYLTRFAADGLLDQTFATNGSVLVREAEQGFSDDYQLARRGDGTLFFRSPGDWRGPERFSAYTANGTPLSSFGVNGTLQPENAAFSIGGFAFQSDGRLVFAGTTNRPQNIALMRFTTAGKADNSLDGDGVFLPPLVGRTGEFHDSSLTTNGKILLAGVADSQDQRGRILIARFNDNGTPDITFDGDGFSTIDLGGYAGAVTELVPLSDGKILLSVNEKLLRLTSAGKLDKSFGGGDGIVPGVSYFALANDGKIIFTRGRLNSNGSRDNSFRFAGLPQREYREREAVSEKVIALPDGKMLYLVHSWEPESPVGLAELLRLNANGSIDNSYGENGFSLVDGREDGIGVPSIARKSNGQIIGVSTAGYDDGGDGLFSAAASGQWYDNTGAARPLLSDHAFGQYERESLSQLSVGIDGSTVVTGALYDEYDPAAGNMIAVSRLAPDGSLDRSFNFGHVRLYDFADSAVPLALPNGDIILAGTDRGALRVAKLIGRDNRPVQLFENGVFVMGTSGLDFVRVSNSGGRFSLERNGVITDLGTTQHLRIELGGGNDVVDIVDAPLYTTVRGDGGNDTLRGVGEFHGGSGNDVILGGDSRNIMAGGPGDDRLEGAGGDDIIFDPFGRNTLIGGVGNDEIGPTYYNSGYYVGFENAATATISGGEGNDSITSFGGNDLVYGGAGDDHIAASGGRDSVYGEGGDDSISFFGKLPNDRGYIEGGAGTDDILGHGKGRATLAGGSGNDTLRSRDTITTQMFGSLGDDFFEPGLGVDDMVGGSGFDTVSYRWRETPLRIDQDENADDGAANEGDNVHADIEGIIGGERNDRIVGGPFDNRIEGAGGRDTLWGGAGNDTLEGDPFYYVGAEAFGDLLYGQDGNDLILARDGAADTIDAGAGDDTIESDLIDTILTH